MATTRSGFDAERFRKYVAMFDSPYRPEAESAFRLALDELAKDQRRFCDQLIDPAEAKAAKKECARMRDELATVFARCARQDAEVEELEDTIDRLNKHVDLVENGHSARLADAYRECARKDAKVGQLEEIIDRLHHNMATGETDFLPSEGDYLDDEPPATDDGAIHDFGFQFEPNNQGWEFGGNTAPVLHSALPFPSAFYWLLLLAFFPVFAGYGLVVGHLLNDSDRNKGLPVFLLGVPTVALTTWLVGRKCHFADTRLGQWLAGKNLAAHKAMVIGFYSACFALMWIYMFPAVFVVGPDNATLFNGGLRIYYGLCNFLGFSLIIVSVRKELSKWGFRGLVLHAFMLVDLLVLFLLIECQLLPWELLQHVKPHLTFSLPLASLSFATLCYVGFTDTVTIWLLETDDRPKWIAAPAVILIIMTFANLAEGTPAPTTRAPQRNAVPAPPSDKSLITYTIKLNPPPATSAPGDNPTASETIPPSRRAGNWVVLGVLAVIFSKFVRGLSKLEEKERRDKAYRDANQLLAKNVHGAADYAKAAAAKKGGWL